MNKSLIYLKHIIEAIDNVNEFSENLSKTQFKKDKLKQSAIIRQIEIVGEAAKSLSSEFKRKHDDIEWKKIAGSRDKLIHHYFGVDLDIVWEIIEKDLPELKVKIKKIIDENF